MWFIKRTWLIIWIFFILFFVFTLCSYFQNKNKVVREIYSLEQFHKHNFSLLKALTQSRDYYLKVGRAEEWEHLITRMYTPSKRYIPLGVNKKYKYFIIHNLTRSSSDIIIVSVSRERVVVVGVLPEVTKAWLYGEHCSKCDISFLLINNKSEGVDLDSLHEFITKGEQVWNTGSDALNE